MKIGTKVRFADWHENAWATGTVYIDNPLRVRIDAGQEWAGQIYSASEDDIEPLPTYSIPSHSSSSPHVEYVEHEPSHHQESHHHELHDHDSHTETTTIFDRVKKFLPTFAIVILVIIAGLYFGSLGRNSPERIQKVRENIQKLNSLDNDNVPDYEAIIEAKKAIKERKEKREKINKDIENLIK